MGTYFTWPWKRKEYAGIGNPRFVSDIVSDNELALEGLKSLLGLGDTDFAIIYGLEYVTGTTNIYNPGVIYFNGVFYSVLNSFVEGLNLAPNISDTMPQPFNDGNSRNIYTTYSTVTTTNPTGSTPVFTGDMNQYRLNLKVLNQSISSINDVLSGLGNSATKNVGTTPGTVAAGDSSFAKSDSDLRYVKKVGDTMTGTLVLAADPTSNLQAATKGYVDTIALKKLASGTTGSLTTISGGSTFTISFGITVPNTSYIPILSINCSSIASGGIDWVIKSKTTTSIDVWVYPQITATNTITIDWMIAPL